MKKQVKAFFLASVLTASVTIPSVMAGTNDSTYTVKSGDTLWKIAGKYDTTIGQLMETNNLSDTTINVGQELIINEDSNQYTVRSGDTLYLISERYGLTINQLKDANHLTSETIIVGQTLTIPADATKDGSVVESATTSKASRPKKVSENSKLRKYIVQPGDTAWTISKKFGSRYSPQKIMKFNYMAADDWFDAGETILVDGYAPRNYEVVPGEASTYSRYGTAVDWFNDGQYIIKRNKNVKIIDTLTGTTFTVKVMGGYNHADVEPITAYDTKIMKSLFKTWKWTPRPVTVYIDGMNIASSLAGQPHSFDTVQNNDVSGHFDLYLKNSKPHNPNTDKNYVKQHQANISISTAK